MSNEPLLNASLLEKKLPISLLTYLEAEQKRLIRDSLLLIDAYQQKRENPMVPAEIHDFAFVVFPFAKAYEGFLKTYFYRNNFIAEKVYSGRHFRVGRSFNPDLPEKYKDEFWIYDDVSALCGEDQARDMWNVWIDARNHLFHYYPDEKYDLTLDDAAELVKHSLEVMHRAVQCIGKNTPNS